MKRSIAVDPQNSGAIQTRMSTIKDVKVYRRFQAILFLSHGKTPEEVSDLTGFSAKHIRNLGKQFNEKGLDEFGADRRKGGNNRLLTNEEAAAFLGEFEKEASAHDKRMKITTHHGRKWYNHPMGMI